MPMMLHEAYASPRWRGRAVAGRAYCVALSCSSWRATRRPGLRSAFYESSCRIVFVYVCRDPGVHAEGLYGIEELSAGQVAQCWVESPWLPAVPCRDLRGLFGKGRVVDEVRSDAQGVGGGVPVLEVFVEPG